MLTSSSADQVSNLALQKQISEVTVKISQVAESLHEIKVIMESIEERVRKLEHSEAGNHPLLNARIDTLQMHIDDHETRLRALTDVVRRLEQSNRLLTWLGGILGSTVVIWILTQMLGVIR